MGFRPNQIPLKERVLCCVLSVFLLVYGGVALWLGDLYVPARRGGFHLQGIPMILHLVAMVCACVAMLMMVIDHYDRRDNERHYRLISRVVQIIGWCCFGVSLVMDVVIKKGWFS